MTKEHIEKVVNAHGYNMYETYIHNEYMFILAGDGDAYGYEIWISFMSKAARMQMLSSIMIHKHHDIADWFWDKEGNVKEY